MKPVKCAAIWGWYKFVIYTTGETRNYFRRSYSITSELSRMENWQNLFFWTSRDRCDRGRRHKREWMVRTSKTHYASVWNCWQRELIWKEKWCISSTCAPTSNFSNTPKTIYSSWIVITEQDKSKGRQSFLLVNSSVLT